MKDLNEKKKKQFIKGIDNWGLLILCLVIFGMIVYALYGIKLD
ncbi:hypothetical protein [Polaribacter sp. Hel1_85]|nr:hypothetical protein [Polaribacter sp. Hel1_85]KGL63657.1 hypothetical protein PHEL85_0696 [Polaribacter sp. Hel1_85]